METRMSVLNPDLYAALQRCFRDVNVSNFGERAMVTKFPDWSRGGRMKTTVTGGEYYYVDCPFCTDLRKRLGIHYCWATDDDGAVCQQDLHLANCFNEGCLATREDQILLYEMVYPHGRWSRGVPRPVVTESDMVDTIVAETQPTISLPRGLVSVNHSTKAVQAGEYLRERGFDPHELWKRWRVCYCHYDADAQPRIRRRIVIPVYSFPAISTGDDQDAEEPILAGWQARVIEDVGGNVPKYWTAKGMRKSTLVYGLTTAVDTAGPGGICEGVTDVWRLRTNAVAIFGKDLSLYQQRLIVGEFANRPLVVFLDDDAREKAVEARMRLLNARKAAGDHASVVIAKLPSGRTDVGECDCDEAWDQVAVALQCTRKELGIDPDLVPATRHPAEIKRRFRPVRRDAA